MDMPISAFRKTAYNEFIAHANASIEASLHGMGEECRRFSDRSTFSFSRCFSRLIYGMAMVSSTPLRHRCAAGGSRLVALTLDGQSLGQMISADLRIRACAVRCS
ncbi:hypothetical protein ACUTR7_26675 [Delftia sp. NA_296.1]|uniref:hypothetical protein n=1 Tax=Delftia sp. NA_296.1 TaxID=3415648 RepID=UPI0040467EE0